MLRSASGREGSPASSRRLQAWTWLPDLPDPRDLNAQAVGAGLTAFAFFLFAPLPLQVVVAAKLGLTLGQTAGWIFAGWFSACLASIWLSLRYRQPVPIVMSVPPVIYVGTLGDKLGFANLVGASIVAGLLILVLALLGAGERIAALVPLPIVLGMFAGTLLPWVVGIVEATVSDVVIAGSAVVGYVSVRRLDRPWLPPVPVAAACGAVVLVALRGVEMGTVEWVWPSLGFAPASFSISTAVAVGVPLAMLTFGLGNVQGIGFLRGEGYAAPARQISVAAGLSSLASATLGGSPTGIGLGSTALVGGSEAGPRGGRYWAALIASAFALFVAIAGGTAAFVLGVLPASYVTVVAGLATWSIFRGSLRGALGGELRVGAAAAFVVAATPFAVAGITSAFWAIPVGVAASAVLERRELTRFWRRASQAEAAV